jgi:hypothetical protein
MRVTYGDGAWGVGASEDAASIPHGPPQLMARGEEHLPLT